MSSVELSATLVARLGALESLVLDPDVSEILIAAPGQVFVTKNGRTEPSSIALDDGAIRALASRLGRALPRRDSSPTRTGLIARELHASVIGAPRGDRCPVIRFVRKASPKSTLSQLAEKGALDRDAELRLLQACRTRRSIVITGHPGSGRTDLLAALGRVWKEERRVAVLDGADGRLTPASVGHVTLEPGAGPEGAALVGAEVVVVDDPAAGLWAELLTFGRPFIATIEASDARSALDRIVAFCLRDRAEMSHAAAIAIVESGVGLVVEMERAHGIGMVRAIAEPERSSGALSARPIMRPIAEVEAADRYSINTPLELASPLSRSPQLGSKPGQAMISELRSVVAIPREQTKSHVVDERAFETSELSEIRPEQLMSASFVGRLGPEIVELDSADPVHPQEASGPSAPPPALAGEVGTKETLREGPTRDLSPRPPSDKVRSLRREASERVPTLIGPPEPKPEPARLSDLAEFGDEDSGELRTASGEGLGMLLEEEDPRRSDEMTMHAEASEMVDGEDGSTFGEEEASLTQPVPDDEAERWDDEAPSELLINPVRDLGLDETDLRPFENEKTPYASMVDSPGDAASERRVKSGGPALPERDPMGLLDPSTATLPPTNGDARDDIEGMLDEIDEFVGGLDSDPKPGAKRRARRVR
jgi:type IV secretory pathway ATPase VirB11/archaellum biosynthesis ATPase